MGSTFKEIYTWGSIFKEREGHFCVSIRSCKASCLGCYHFVALKNGEQNIIIHKKTLKRTFFVLFSTENHVFYIVFTFCLHFFV